ncbi:ThiJ/PfpI domain-containing protein [Cunninghamella echinulata]|nr:ThiJ/PfpI domain-containing protein [Cunninghamella echinulata]
MSTEKQWLVGILLFNEVEVLDFAGPFEVFSVTQYENSGKKPFIVKIIGETGKLITASNGLKIQPDYSIHDDTIHYDILIVPGGYGARKIEIHNTTLLNWIKAQYDKVDILASVCTGAYLLAKVGLLDGKKVTTHWRSTKSLQETFPKLEVLENVKFVDQGKILTSAGISAGINLSFHIIKRLIDQNTAETTAKRMEYDIIIE